MQKTLFTARTRRGWIPVTSTGMTEKSFNFQNQAHSALEDHGSTAMILSSFWSPEISIIG
jgi:hypothetical protein